MKYTKEQLVEKTKAELLKIAKELGIKGRHDMRKEELIEAIVKISQPEAEIKPKTDYIENAKVGVIIAFKVNKDKVLSGMIEEIHKTQFVVKTKNGVRFNVNKSNVIWVKTGDRWPKGVYLALRGMTNEAQTINS